MSLPVCCIAIPVYNRVKYVQTALQSAMEQETPGIEKRFLIIDNCSTDGTWELLQSLSYPNLRLLRNDENIGWVRNFNRCIREAEGDYLVLLGSDDRILPGVLQHELTLMRQHPAVALVTTRHLRVDENRNPLGVSADHMRPGIFRGREIIGGAVWVLANYARSIFNYPAGMLMRMSAVRQAGEFDTTLKHVADMDYCFKLLEHGDLAVSDQIGCEITEHPGTLTDDLYIGGEFTRDWFTLADRWSTRMPARMYRSALQQSVAWSLLFARRFDKRGKPDIAHKYREIARTHPMTASARLTALARLYSTLHTARFNRQPVKPYEPLKSSP